MKLIDPVLERAQAQSRARRKRVVMNVLKYVGVHRRLVTISAVLSSGLVTVLFAVLWINAERVSGAAQARASPLSSHQLDDPSQGIYLKLSYTLNPIYQTKEGKIK
ncbi:MAG: hypothetical protein QM533_11605 [Cytophagales bacterium]|nr:hypothetical protein [Cytophagales bacterium]